LSALGLASRTLTDDTPREERDRAKGDLTRGAIQVLCVVDLFNEGVDIPDVNTLFLFRPTESATEALFQWQSQSRTREDGEDGLRHLRPADHGVMPLLFVRESKKDARGVANAFRYLGPVQPRAHRGERPITIERELSTPLLPEWVRRWRNVT